MNPTQAYIQPKYMNFLQVHKREHPVLTCKDLHDVLLESISILQHTVG